MPEKFEKFFKPDEESEKKKENPVACLACGKEEESPGYDKHGLPKKPKGWKQYHGHFFCPTCVEKKAYKGFEHW